MLFREPCVHNIRVTVSYYCWQTKGEEQDTGKNKVKRVSLLVLEKAFYGFHVVIKITLVKLSSLLNQCGCNSVYHHQLQTGVEVCVACEADILQLALGIFSAVSMVQQPKSLAFQNFHQWII